MKVSKIALATTLALASMSAAAGVTIPANVVFVAGATGVDGYMQAAIASMLNVTAKITSKSSVAWVGTTNAAWNGLASGTEVMVIKRSAGGSAIGVAPLAANVKTNIPDFANANQTGQTGVNWTTGDLSDAAGLVPDIGVSDVEPVLFKGWNLENGYSALTTAQGSNLTVSAWGVLAEGIVATKAVADSTVLSNNFIREAMAGHYKTWAPADATSDPIILCERIPGSGTQAAYNSYFEGYPNTSAYNGYGNNTVKSTTSSLGYGATAAGLGSQLGDVASNAIGIDPSAGFTVFQADGSADVRKCLQAAQLHSDVALKGLNGLYYNLKFSGTQNVATQGLGAVGTNTTSYKAIGVLSLDSYTKTSGSTNRTVDGNGVAASNSDNTGEYTFRFLNGNGTFSVKDQSVTTTGTSTGVAPSRANILTGAYDFVVEPTLQYRKKSVLANGNVDGTNAAAANGSTGPTKTYITGTTGFAARLLAIVANPVDMEVGSPNNTTPLAYAAVPMLYTKTNDSASTRLVVDLTHQGNTTSPLHVKQ